MSNPLVPVIDISHHQGDVDFTKMVAAGVRGVIIRLGIGATTDDRADRYVADARSAGLAVGGYWFCNPKRDASGAMQMTRFVRSAKRLGIELPLMMDVEACDAEHGPLPMIKGDDFLAWLQGGADLIEHATGRAPIIYTGGPFWDAEIGAAGRLVRCPLILARYPLGPNTRVPADASRWEQFITNATPKRPRPPVGWTDWAGWQFSAQFNGLGAAFGASSTDIDLNLVTADAWSSWTSPAATVAPSATTLLKEDVMATAKVTVEGRDAVFYGQGTLLPTGHVHLVTVTWGGADAVGQADTAFVADHDAQPDVVQEHYSPDTLRRDLVLLGAPTEIVDTQHQWTRDDFFRCVGT